MTIDNNTDSSHTPDSKFSWKFDEYSQSHVISVWDMIQPPGQTTWKDLQNADFETAQTPFGYFLDG